MFKRTRLKLTGWYVLMVMLVCVFFSVVIYQMLSSEVDRFAQAQQLRFERRLHSAEIIAPPPTIDVDLVADSKHRIILNLLVVNSSILLMAGAIGYFLSGVTLKPIAVMLDEQKRFVSDASHELRTPLTALKSMLEVGLRDPKLNLKESKSLISQSIDETNKLANLSSSLLELATDSQQPRRSYVNLKLKNLVTEAANKVSNRAQQKEIKIISKTNGTIVHGNLDKLTQLLVILLDNAVKYSPAKSKIIISALTQKNHAVVKVSDQGIGIDAKDLPHIFERFYRADTARGHEYEGSYGLGLAIAKKIVDTHHGSINAISQLNKGTTFIIKLPLA